jgi:hypothetical protein
MAVRIYLFDDEILELHSSLQLLISMIEVVSDVQGTPYATAYQKLSMLDGFGLVSPRSTASVKFTEKELGALMCMLGVLPSRDTPAYHRVAAKISLAAEQRASSIIGILAMRRAVADAKATRHWGLENVPVFTGKLGGPAEVG